MRRDKAGEEVCVLRTECGWRNVMCKMPEIHVAELHYLTSPISERTAEQLGYLETHVYHVAIN
jgi:hypothetical protein